MLTDLQEKTCKALRKGVSGALEPLPKDDERREQVLVTNKATDVETLLDAVDALRSA